jgi:CxxC motif-containing protein
VEEKAASGSTAEPALTITGNRCKRGLVYAQEEIRAPKRVVTATCGIIFPTETISLRNLTSLRRLPVKTSAPCPKEKINELLADIYKLKVNLPVKTGEKLISDWGNSGIDVVAVRTLE